MKEDLKTLIAECQALCDTTTRDMKFWRMARFWTILITAASASLAFEQAVIMHFWLKLICDGIFWPFVIMSLYRTCTDGINRCREYKKIVAKHRDDFKQQLVNWPGFEQ